MPRHLGVRALHVAAHHASMGEVCEGAPVAVGGWVLTDRHDLAPCATNGVVCRMRSRAV